MTLIGHDVVLAVVDERNSLRGLAKISLNCPPVRGNACGFDGYVLNHWSGETLRMIALDASLNMALACIPLKIAASTNDAR